MDFIGIPDLEDRTVLEKCCSGISNEELRNRFDNVIDTIVSEGLLYRAKAKSNRLNTLKPSNIADDDVVLGEVKKKELTQLYSRQLVRGAGKEFYDQLKNRVPEYRCPFCGVTQLEELDHFLPKKNYPIFSVYTANLVPICKKCNHTKGSKVAAKASDQLLHPYFDKEPFQKDQWLFAEIKESPSYIDGFDALSVVVSYKVLPPKRWTLENKRRVQAHCELLDLKSRYSKQAASSLSDLKFLFEKYISDKDYNSLMIFVRDLYSSAKKNRINSFQTAFYGALLEYFQVKFLFPKQEGEVSEAGDLETCPRCQGKKLLLDSPCDACDGVGSAGSRHFESLGDSIYEPVKCDCPDGLLGCKICNGKGEIDLERAWAM